MVLAGFKDSGQIAADPIGLPNPWVFTNYTEILSSGVFWQEMGNSIFVAALSTAMVVIFAALAAFVFARRSFPGRALFTLFTLGLLFPSAVAILPLFSWSANWGCSTIRSGSCFPRRLSACP